MGATEEDILGRLGKRMKMRRMRVAAERREDVTAGLQSREWSGEVGEARTEERRLQSPQAEAQTEALGCMWGKTEWESWSQS